MESEEDVDIEGDFKFDAETDNIIESRLAIDMETPAAESDHDLFENADHGLWPPVGWTLDSADIDMQSRETIMAMLHEDALPLTTSPPRKTNQALDETSRRRGWSEEEKALFLTGVEIYGKSWKHIAELLPSRSSQQVRRYGIQYFKEKDLEKAHKRMKTIGVVSPPALELEVRKALPENCVHVREETEDVLVDILSDEHDSPRQSADSISADQSKHNSENQSGCAMTAVNQSEGSTIAVDQSELVTTTVNQSDRLAITADQSQLGMVIDPGPDDIDVTGMEDESMSSPELAIDAVDNDTETVTSKHQEDPVTLLQDEESNPGEPVAGVLDSNGDLIPMDIPVTECSLDRDTITQLESRVHFEFFQNRVNKTPERYLRIRNYIVDQWEKCRPKYLNKTSIRSGLRQCGDVNCIGRIHSFLEQIGAINFGCEQVVYSRFPAPGKTSKMKSKEEGHVTSQMAADLKQRRRRPKDWSVYKEGVTTEHDPDDMFVAPPSKTIKSQKKTPKVDPFRLIKCSEFGDSLHEAPYRIEVEVSAAVIMDIHSHLCKTEVIGMLGGLYDEQKTVLRIVRAEPCNSWSSTMHCDMDPVSQTKAGQLIQEAGLKVIGWYHSHPTFAPDPSLQDMESQGKFQDWFAKGGQNFVGIIISPYNEKEQSMVSEIRCFTSLKGTTVNSECVPYKFDHSLVSTKDSLGDLQVLVQRIGRLLDMYSQYDKCWDLSAPYKPHTTVTALNKMLESVGHYLESAETQVSTSMILEDIKYVALAFCERQKV